MPLRSFAVERYRGFKERTEIELRPLTLLFGYNSAGKSALLRVLPLIRDTLRTGGEPIDFRSDAARGASFSELNCRLSGTPVIAFELADEVAAMRYEIRDLSPRERRQVIERVIRSEAGSEEEFEWTTEGSRYERRRDGRAAGFGEIYFNGLDLHGEIDGAPLIRRLPGERALRQVQWLDALRARVPRWMPYGARPRGPLASDGHDAPAALAFAREDASEVYTGVQDFYRRYLGHEVEVVPRAERFQVKVRRVSAAVSIDLTDTGEGLAQVLPVAVSLARAGLAEGPHLVALEQPELHLHPAMHEELARWMCAVVSRASQARLLIETHSENFLLAVMLAVIEGHVPPDDVLVYWVHQLDDGQSVVERVTLDELARPQGAWPPNVFQEDAALATRLNTLRLRKLRG